MFKKVLAVALTLTLALGLMLPMTMTAAAEETEIFATSINYGAMWGDEYKSWTVGGAWNCWGVIVQQGTISEGKLAVPLRSPTEQSLRSEGHYLWSDMVTVTLAEPTLVTRVVLKSVNAGEYPNNFCLNYRDANTKNPTALELAADQWRYVDHMAAGYEGVAKTVNYDGNTVELIFAEPVVANAVQVQALANHDQCLGDVPWTISEFHVYGMPSEPEESSKEEPSENSKEPEESKEPEITVSLGDVNGDGNINAIDASRILLSVVGKVTLDETAQKAADVNGDGKINAIDASLILLHAVGKKLIEQ